MSRAATRRGALTIVAVACAAAALLPAIAAAKPQPEFNLNGGGGYRIHVSGSGSTVTLSVFRPKALSAGSLGAFLGVSAKGHGAPTSFGAASSTYIARGEASASSIRAQFPGFGRVAVRFHPTGKVTRLGSQGCGLASRAGVFRGAVSFEGEGGYTDAHVHSARGEVVVPSPSHCSRSSRILRSSRRAAWLPPAALGVLHAAGVPNRTIPPSPSGPKATFLQAFWKSPLGLTAFDAIGDGSGPAHYIAAVEQSEGQVAIDRLALGLAPAHTFTTDSALNSAALLPPSPFSGDGAYLQAGGGTPSWTGSLAVSFPGAEDIPLTGPQFTSQLARSW
ncbi:MAG: hypothetical protein WB507_05570 [Solirubrobacterales bacterium]